MPRAPLALRLCLLCALLPLFVRPTGKKNALQKLSLAKAIQRKGSRPVRNRRAGPIRRIHQEEPPPPIQSFGHPHNRGNRTKLFYLSGGLNKLGKLRIVFRRVRCNDAGEMKDALGGPPKRTNHTGKIDPCERDENKGETKPLDSANPQEDQPQSIDFYITQYEDRLLKRPSKIMDLSPPRQNEQTEGKKKKKEEATLDDILYGGLLNIYKPVNMYSMKVCERVKHVLRDHFKQICKKKLNFKVGHGGTLDPFAEGVLVIGIQKGTKKLSDFLKCYKKYLALGLFGLETDTLDREGKVVKISNEMMKGTPPIGVNTHDSLISQKNITLTLSKFIGHVYQTPPIYSAKRVDGMRLYEYARKKISVQIKPSKVHIQKLKYLNQVDLPFFDLDIKCSGGTYIRSLVRDFAHAMNTHATLVKLIRVQQGEHFLYEHSLHYDDINMENIKRHLIKL
ncbi:Trna pseudouridine synthase [Plasmodium coatneyi]|uniref:tRNA pseudouridine(55) synthase n=1 Tax=Plasmodium coatneyi TaxID=208452 RepID=A0A1B1DW59_9APIC|nr:Trna pseudouridine synthase [Plasmodium coatneyi]ANQ06990.1 Trna pseudouridine synthase [Plasmodium coatneyi]